jgi:predicted O-methyltransferase YrrM
MLNENLSKVLGVSLSRLKEFVNEAYEIDLDVKKMLGNKRLWALHEEKRAYLYATVKALEPQIAVETGVGPGVSTTFILSALRKGILYSIDLGEKYGEEAERYEIGFVVPDRLKQKWKLILGDSKKLLKELLDELQEIQFFLHDGEHTYENVMFELNEAWKHMKKGVIMVDNFEFNNATVEFSKRVKSKLLVLSHKEGGFAMIPKLE